jgi:hypothetical protein
MPQRLNRQPQYLVSIAPEYLAYAKCCVIGSVYQERINALNLWTWFTETNVNGRSLNNGTSAGYTLTTDCNKVLPTGTEVTVLWQGKKRADLSSAPGTFGNGSFASADEFNIYCPYSGDGKVYWRWGGETDGTSSLNVAGMSFSEYDWWAFTSGPRGMEIWQNFKKVSSNAAVPSRSSSSSKSFYWGSADSTGFSTVTASMLVILAKQLPAAFLGGGNYWNVLAPLKRSVYFGAATGAPAVGPQTPVIVRQAVRRAATY